MFAPISRSSLTERRLVVSIHDLRPGVQDVCSGLIGNLAALGVDRTSLLVVPDWKSDSSEGLREDFVSWLKRLEDRGHEIVLHGLNHSADRPGRGVKDFVARRLYTNSESEFHGLDGDEAERRLRRGMELFRDAGFAPGGFVAPAWLMSDGTLSVLGRLGFEYTTTWGGILDLARMRMHRAPCIVWSSRAGWRTAISLVWVRLWSRVNRGAQILRIAVHPPDIAQERCLASVLRTVDRAGRGRIAATYGEVAALLRSRA